MPAHRPSNSVRLDDPACTVKLVRNTRARRFTLRLSASAGEPILTVPPRIPETEIRMFLMRHADWLRKALSKQPERVVVQDGATLPVGGTMVLVRTLDGPRRPPVLDGGHLVLQGHGNEGMRVAAWLKVRARDALLPATRAYARRLGRQIARISLRDTTSRWGSCSSSGTVSFSWRLAMAPPAVMDYVAAHEAAHLVEMNHSDRYWATLASIMPDYLGHRDWLKREGRHLHAYRFTEDA